MSENLFELMLAPFCLTNEAPVLFGRILAGEFTTDFFQGMSCGLTLKSLVKLRLATSRAKLLAKVLFLMPWNLALVAFVTVSIQEHWKVCS